MGNFGKRPVVYAGNFAVGIFLIFLCRCVNHTALNDRFSDTSAIASPQLVTPPANANQFSFAIVADLHISHQDTSRLSRILAAAAAENDAFLLLLGDIVDTGARDDMLAVQAAITSASWQGKVFPVVGNHDIFNDGWSNYRDLMAPSHYVFTAGNSKFITIDTGDSHLGSQQMAWLENQLDQPSPGNIFVLSHYLPIISGQRTYLKISSEKEARHLMKISSSHHVTAWLGGHYHSFVVSEADGVAYVAAGGGGGRRMEPVTTNFFVQVQVNQNTANYILHPIE